MKIVNLSVDEKKRIVVFEVSGTSPSYLNSLRRYMMGEVPVLAIEDVEIRKNDSGLYDEIIAHRLGLLPITTDLKTYNLPQDCKCKGAGCGRCKLTITLKAKGPGIVYAGDMKSKDPKAKPVFPKTPIVKLLDGQEIELEASAVMGLGKVHAKWSPCLAYYRELADVKIEKQPDNKEEIAQKCGPKVFKHKGDLSVENAKDCTLCGACVDLSAGKIKVTPNGTFQFTVESWGQLDPEEIVVKALETYDEQLEALTALVKK